MNPITHFEIPFDDDQRAKEFYMKTFGWTFQDMPDLNYIMAMTTDFDQTTQMPTKPGEINGGMYKRHEGPSSKSPVLVVHVVSMDKALADVKANGGEIVVDKVQVGDFGLYAQFKDTEGNILGLWEMLSKKHEKKEEE